MILSDPTILKFRTVQIYSKSTHIKWGWYWIVEEYQNCFNVAEFQKMFDKENFCGWFIEIYGFKGHGEILVFIFDIRIYFVEKYMDVFEVMIGCCFEVKLGVVVDRIIVNLIKVGFFEV